MISQGYLLEHRKITLYIEYFVIFRIIAKIARQQNGLKWINPVDFRGKKEGLKD